MTTINISLPEQLKKEADNLVGAGYYVSFSDLVRDSLRRVIYDEWYQEAKKDEKEGQTVVLKSKKDIDNYFKKI